MALFAIFFASVSYSHSQRYNSYLNYANIFQEKFSFIGNAKPTLGKR